MRILVELRSILEPFLWALFLVMAWKPVVDGIEFRLEHLLALVFPSLRSDPPSKLKGRDGELGRGTGIYASTSRRIGQELWKAPLQDLPSCSFFPRQHYGVACFSSGDGLMLLGGSNGHLYFNDVWCAKLLSKQGMATWQWQEVSPQMVGRRDPMDGRFLLSKWPSRGRFAVALVTTKSGANVNARAIYVTGGQGANCFEDFWASEDEGCTWYCMCRSVPWGGRLDPGLCVVPTKYEQVVLVGGIVPGIHLRVEGDVWISDDAGSTWQRLEAPDWEPRSCPLLFFMPPQHGQRQLLVLGGARLAE
eukprot:symbB.v1.2.027151.t1/scaffold2761.1/size71313/3